jgi:hypothetical protein
VALVQPPLARRCSLSKLGDQGHEWAAEGFDGKGNKGAARVAVALVHGTFGCVLMSSRCAVEESRPWVNDRNVLNSEAVGKAE